MTIQLRAGSFGGRDILSIAVIAALWVALSLVVNPVGDFPLNDDWLYGGTVKSLLSGGGLQVPGAVRGPTIANIVSQAVWGAAFCLPTGFSYTNLRISTLVLALIGLGFFFALIRENGHGRPMAVATTLALAVNPLYFGLGESFMTDVPFVAMMIISLYLLTRSLREDSMNCLLAGVFASLVAILTKQIGFAPLLAYAVANALKHRFRVRPAVLGVVPLILGVGLHVAFQRWLISSGRGSFIEAQIIPLDVASLVSWSNHVTLYALPYIGFALFPIVAMTGLSPRSIRGTRTARIAWPCTGAAGVVALVLLWSRGDLIPFLGNIFNQWGMGPLTLRDTYLLRQNLPLVTGWTTSFWIAVTACGLIGIIAFFAVGIAGVVTRAGELWRGWPDRNDWAWLMAAGTAFGYWPAIILLSTYTGEFWDRYVLPALPVALILLVSGAAKAGREDFPKWRTCLTGAILILIGGLSVAATHDYLEWNRTRWTALRYLTAELGIPPTDIDGGYEFNGSTVFQPAFRPLPGKSWWWVQDDEYVVASGPMPGYSEIKRYPITTKYLPAGLSLVVVLRRTNSRK